MSFVEFLTTSNFTFLSGASHPDELVAQAAELGYSALGLSDTNTLAGIVRAYSTARNLGLPYHVGCRLVLQFSPTLPQDVSTTEIVVYPYSLAGYQNLCRLLTLGNSRAEKGACLLSLDDFLMHERDWIIILVPPPHHDRLDNTHLVNWLDICKRVKRDSVAPDLISIALVRSYLHNNKNYEQAIIDLADTLRIRLLASNNVSFHAALRRPLQDVLTCIKHGCTVFNAGYLLQQNAENYLKSPQEMQRLFRDIPQALQRGLELSERASAFSLSQLKYEYPEEVCPHDNSPLEYLKQLTFEGARERYPQGIPDKVRQNLEEEFNLITELKYEKYFLTCYDIVRFARSKDILCQGRGAAANSSVCYCLGVTAVDPTRVDLLFARFVSKERNEPPDIDIDFEHERREEVIQYVYDRFGRDRAALTSSVTTYRQRSAVREVGKALGLSLQEVDALAKSIHAWTGYQVTREDLEEAGLEVKDARLMYTMQLTKELLSFPRHLSQHVGGFVISQTPLCEIVPITNSAMEKRTIIEWDKDDIEELGMLKIDVLALGMLTCIRKSLDFINLTRNLTTEDTERKIQDSFSLFSGPSVSSVVKDPSLQLHTIPPEDPIVYDMICAADTVGVFQIESRAQMSMLPRLRPRCYYDLVIEVAIVRPGPIQGNMVHPFLKRRQGLEKPHYPDKRVEDVLGKTLGVPLFQEQAMRLAIVLANFTPGEAEQLRRAMAAWKRDKGVIASFKKRIVAGMLRNGYSLEFAENCMNQIKGFSEYGFPESHAASFALLVYASCWIKKHYPAEFLAAILNSQPMGFYAPAQLIQDAQRHAVKVLPIDCNFSTWETQIVYDANKIAQVRLGFHLVKGLAEDQGKLIEEARKTAGYLASVRELWNRTHLISSKRRLQRRTLELLAHSDAFSSMGLDQRQALWEIRALPKELLPLDGFDNAHRAAESKIPKPKAQLAMFFDYEATGFSLRAHPIEFIRPKLRESKASTAASLKDFPEAKQKPFVSVAGIGICRQRPGTASGVVFITLEDETGISNLIIRPHVFDKFSKEIVGSATFLASGFLERTGEVIYINVQRIQSLDAHVFKEKSVDLPSRSYSY